MAAIHLEIGGAATTKYSAERAGRLGLPQHQEPPVAQRVGEELQRALLQLLGEVDQHVAAEHQVDAGERGALAQVVLAEDRQRRGYACGLCSRPSIAVK